MGVLLVYKGYDILVSDNERRDLLAYKRYRDKSNIKAKLKDFLTPKDEFEGKNESPDEKRKVVVKPKAHV